jgi:hypothetical protein
MLRNSAMARSAGMGMANSQKLAQSVSTGRLFGRGASLRGRAALTRFQPETIERKAFVKKFVLPLNPG